MAYSGVWAIAIFYFSFSAENVGSFYFLFFFGPKMKLLFRYFLFFGRKKKILLRSASKVSKNISTWPCSDCPNKNIFSDPLNREYDNSVFCKSASKLFHTLVAAAAKVLSPKQLEDRWTVSVLVSAERSSLARASVTS